MEDDFIEREGRRRSRFLLDELVAHDFEAGRDVPSDLTAADESEENAVPLAQQTFAEYAGRYVGALIHSPGQGPDGSLARLLRRRTPSHRFD